MSYLASAFLFDLEAHTVSFDFVLLCTRLTVTHFILKQ